MQWKNVNLRNVAFLAAFLFSGFHPLKIKIRQLLSVEFVILQVIIPSIENLPGVMYFAYSNR